MDPVDSGTSSAAAASIGLTTAPSAAPGAPRGLAAAVRPVGSAVVGPAAPVVAQAAAPTPRAAAVPGAGATAALGAGATAGGDYFLGLPITADSDCSHEIKRCLLLGRKAMMKLDSVLKSRDITWLTKVHLVKAVVFSVVMYRCESWTIKKTEHRRIYAFELWCWRRLLRVPWTTRRSNQSILKEINPEYSLEGLMLKL